MANIKERIVHSILWYTKEPVGNNNDLVTLFNVPKGNLTPTDSGSVWLITYTKHISVQCSILYFQTYSSGISDIMEKWHVCASKYQSFHFSN